MNDSFNLVLSNKEIITRIIVSILIGGMIGYDRGLKNRPAGFRTHILVCLGACVVSLIQDQLRVNIINFAIAYPDQAQIIKSDIGRIGAGTIMRDKGTIGGLTTAASIWATGCLGLGIGWGFYSLSIITGIAIILVLVTLKSFEASLIDKKYTITLEILFKENECTDYNMAEVYTALREMNIKIKNLKKFVNENKFNTTLIVPKQIDQLSLISNISKKGFVSGVNIK
ncbi:Protein SapB [Fusobacterium sp. DD29]|uniref:MgtC/SapB family protein n=1 Tax=unclassified Fusobacterium TaxID=2648384 RepID=UPI001B8C8AB9|nr:MULTISPECIES: MgtC/SapB family protein [unclassified Fusobacterium]MBR8749855.1 Protein SapB [Fusobacterium sp. DD29]MBR8762097.1 Protein SapB [Fusobacterium sp. DD25]MBR8768131.1 Protein SapB [Fusobacterium sp. DD43]MBR8772175.1 Protein SapB [Fusobacterium sp. DD40]MBR8776409.1 Protein SapB [Fusobacterium sp. DD17]